MDAWTGRRLRKLELIINPGAIHFFWSQED
jgi:hypothetical protein